MLKLKLLLTTGLLFFALIVSSMPGPGGGPPGPPGGPPGPPCWAPPCIPIDGGVVFLIAGGCIFGIVKLIRKDENNN